MDMHINFSIFSEMKPAIEGMGFNLSTRFLPKSHPATCYKNQQGHHPGLDPDFGQWQLRRQTAQSY